MTDKKNLPARTSNDDRNALQNSGSGSRSVLDMATQNLTAEEFAAIRSKALDEKLRMEVEAQQRSIDYQFGTKAAEDHVEAFNMLEKSGKLTSQKIQSDIKTGAGNMRIESKSGATCFVATAAYGDPNHEDVIFLRRYRDDILRLSLIGRIFIATYWKIGPYLAIPVMKIRPFQRTARSMIRLLVKYLRRTSV
jgi:hypothetical protein